MLHNRQKHQLAAHIAQALSTYDIVNGSFWDSL